MPRDHTRSETWKQWSGSLDDLAALARRSMELVGPDQKREEHCQIEVVLPGLDSTYESPDELVSEVRDSDRPRVERVTIRVGTSRHAQRVVLAFDRYTGVSVKVQGSSLHNVEGTASLLSKDISQGAKKRRIASDQLGIGAGVAVMFVGFGILSGVIEAEPESEEGIEGVAGLVAIFAATGLVAGTIVGVTRLASWLRPRLEILAPNQRRRWLRLRRRVVGGALAVLLAVAALLAEQFLF